MLSVSQLGLENVRANENICAEMAPSALANDPVKVGKAFSPEILMVSWLESVLSDDDPEKVGNVYELERSPWALRVS